MVDELPLMVDALMLGGGKRIFRDDGLLRPLRPLRLVDGQLMSTGAMLASYVPAA